MIEYATRAVFKDLAGQIPLNEQASVRKGAESRSPLGATFLSHSSKDGDLVIGAIRLLESHGAKVYVDKKDATLPPYTSSDTAKALKDRIHQSKKFVVLASESSKDSRWVPWELGLADVAKGIGRIAILPAVDGRDKTSWTSWEYLGLYHRIVWGDLKGEPRQVWMVLDERKNTATKLSDWLMNG